MAFNQNEAFQNPEERQLQEWRGQALARLVGSWARNNAPDRVQAGRRPQQTYEITGTKRS